MLTIRLASFKGIRKIVLTNNRSFCNKTCDNGIPDANHPIRRTLKVLGDDMRKVKDFFVPKQLKKPKKNDTFTTEPGMLREIDNNFQSHCDVLVIGGGGIGSSIAYWLKKKARDGLNVVVVEEDNSYKQSSTVLCGGGLRQKFSLAENIQMSLYGSDFVRTIKDHLGDDIELDFTPHGHLVMTSEEGAESLAQISKLQCELGARNEILTAKQLKQKFPWLNTNGIVLGCHGLQKEGWFDPWALLVGFKKRAKQYGAHFVDAEIVGFEFRPQQNVVVEGGFSVYEGLDKAVLKMANAEKRTIKFALCVIAAGADSGRIAKLARVGTGSGMLAVPLPVEPRKRYIYVFTCKGDNAPGLNTPLTVDPTNTYFRRDGLGGNYIGGLNLSSKNEPSIEDLDLDYHYFETYFRPNLAARIPAFESIKVRNAWSGFYEYNTFDENGIIGCHPYYHNLYIATGFSGHGTQQTPAVGRAISELIIDGTFRTIDLTRLGFDRIVVDQPMFEVNIV